MPFAIDFSWVGKPVELCLLDLLLCGDNALVIALACRTLPAYQRRRAMNLGICGAVLTRFVLTAAASLAFDVPGLKIVGGLLLLLIAFKLTGKDNGPKSLTSTAPEPRSDRNMIDAVMLILCVDVLMSFDNTVALAAVAQGNLVLLGLGLGLSVPALMFGTRIMEALIERYQVTIILGGMFLGWIAGAMAVSDSIVQHAIRTEAQALPYTLPPLVALYVFLQARIDGTESWKGESR